MDGLTMERMHLLVALEIIGMLSYIYYVHIRCSR